MPVFSNIIYWRIPLAVFAVLLALFGKRKGVTTIIVCILAVGLTDSVCGNIIKPLVHRMRPLGGTTFSFPSNHTANLFAAAAVIFYFYRKAWVGITVLLIALVGGFSRIYTTSHYPSDVLGGAVIGLVFAYLMIFIYHLAFEKEKKDKNV